MDSITRVRRPGVAPLLRDLVAQETKQCQRVYARCLRYCLPSDATTVRKSQGPKWGGHSCPPLLQLAYSEHLPAQPNPKAADRSVRFTQASLRIF